VTPPPRASAATTFARSRPHRAPAVVRVAVSPGAAGSSAGVTWQPRSEERRRACCPCAVSALSGLAAGTKRPPSSLYGGGALVSMTGSRGAAPGREAEAGRAQRRTTRMRSVSAAVARLGALPSVEDGLTSTSRWGRRGHWRCCRLQTEFDAVKHRFLFFDGERKIAVPTLRLRVLLL
jgi:hypothetical protein